MRTIGACGLALIACAVTAQAEEDAATSNNAAALAAKMRLQNCQAARRDTRTWTPQEQAHYRDMGCWQPVTADNGARFMIDLGSIEPLARGATIVIYQDEGGRFNPMNLQRWMLTCEGHYRVMLDQGMTDLIYAPPQSVADQISSVACSGAGVGQAIPTQSQPSWLRITGPSGEIQAIIDTGSVTHDSAGNAHARVCLYQDGQCPPGWTQRWFFNCRDHSYSPIDTSVLPQFPHDMNQAEPGSVADQLGAAACR